MAEKIPVSLQMYTLRDDAARDFAGTLEAVAKIGYAGVELAGYYDKTAPEVKQILEDNGLIATGTHNPIESLENNLDDVIAFNQTLGSRFVICPYLSPDRRADIAAYQRLGESFNDIGAKLKEAGITFCYHNHDFEFDKFGGDVYAFDALYAASDPALVQIEMDTYWVKKGGEDPADYIRKYPNRVPLLHIKDMTAGDNPTFAEVGEGIMDYPSLFAAAPVGGAQVYVVEQDVCHNHPPLESVAISFRNLQRMGIA